MDGSAGGGPAISGLPAFCRVVGRIVPEKGSNIRFEVWLPSENWDGRLHGAGNGGFAGFIAYLELSRAVAAGQAGVSTDTGHAAPNTHSDWAIGHPERVRDYGWRAIHLSAVAAKKLVGAFYGRGPDRSYFMSCSNGGRQALMEASRFPEDYDGIIAGAPAAPFTSLVLSHAWSVQAQLPAGAALRPDQMKLLQAEVIKQCDASDGQVDGLIDDPRMCKLDLARLACGTSDSGQCFSPAQLGALAKIYQGPRNSAGGQLAGGFPAAGAEMPNPVFGWNGWIVGAPGQPTQHWTLSNGLLQHLPATPIATPETFDFDRDPTRLQAALGKDLIPAPDLSRFFARGGKLLMYHGWSDWAIPAQFSLDYREAVLRASGRRAAASLRLFMVPGMQHCMGGTGGASFGQLYAAGPNEKPERNIASALQAWVETGRTPDTLVGRRGLGDFGPPSATPAKERLLCAYPKKAVLKPGADPDVATSYTCRPGKHR